MFGDANPTAAFGRSRGVVLAVLVLAVGATACLYALGLPLGWSGGAFVALVLGLLALAWPLFARTQPRFDVTSRR